MRKKRPISRAEGSELHRLDREIDHLQDEINTILEMLGDERFRDISGASGEQPKCL